jgi:hypothetical protein
MLRIDFKTHLEDAFDHINKRNKKKSGNLIYNLIFLFKKSKHVLEN